MQEYRPSSFKLLPDVVKNIMIICGLAFLLNIILQGKGIDINSFLGLYYPGSENFHWWQYFSHLFMHGNFMHIFSNMLAFWMFGNVLENLWGPKRFLLYFLVTGIGAAMLYNLFTYYEISQLKNNAEIFFNTPSADGFAIFVRENIPYQYLNPEYSTVIDGIKTAWYESGDSSQVIQHAKEAVNEYIRFKENDIPMVGASGAVFGILLAFGMLFPNSVIYLYFAIPVKAKYFVALYGAFELYSAIQSNPTDNVAHVAHLGGMLFGFFLIKYWNKNNRSHMY